MLLHTTETPNETFSRFCTRQKRQMKLFHASAHDRNTKWNFFMLLHTTETPTFPRQAPIRFHPLPCDACNRSGAFPSSLPNGLLCHSSTIRNNIFHAKTCKATKRQAVVNLLFNFSVTQTILGVE